jgi:hypothetical protein
VVSAARYLERHAGTRLGLKSVAQAAATPLYVAFSGDVAGAPAGSLFQDCQLTRAPHKATDALAATLWETSRRLVEEGAGEGRR